ncbi:MAG: exodeoxyribonuclease VII large subunit [candidate division KSB1 bacterium]|nr:exodeoxyribonuclease VII large subunit [candidate division KSB1 bacterium]
MDEGYHVNVLTVSELTFAIKELLETSLPLIWVTGEISNFVHHGSGHMYFSLKDEKAQLSCVMWRGRNAALGFTPESGKQVEAFGRIRVYEKRGHYQLDIMKMVPAGVGDLQAAFEKLKQKLLDEGLFDEAHKQELPRYPERIGIVTSPTGAAIRDIVQVLNRRFPGVKKILRPAVVQGDNAAQDIANAIDELNLYGEMDVMIVGRGGGSLEDLWAFNEEPVARAVYDSEIPVISAVGHEIDFTICDFVADYRAPTPSAAAEIAVVDAKELLLSVRSLNERCVRAVDDQIKTGRQQLKQTLNQYGFRRPGDRIRQYRQTVDELLRTVGYHGKYMITKNKDRYLATRDRLKAMHPAFVLKRGYAVIKEQQSGRLVPRLEQATHADVEIQFYDGLARSRIYEKFMDKIDEKMCSNWVNDD